MFLNCSANQNIPNPKKIAKNICDWIKNTSTTSMISAVIVQFNIKTATILVSKNPPINKRKNIYCFYIT